MKSKTAIEMLRVNYHLSDYDDRHMASVSRITESRDGCGDCVVFGYLVFFIGFSSVGKPNLEVNE